MNDPGTPRKVDEPEFAAELSANDRLNLSAELRAIEAEWARLSPRTDRLNRDRIMYLAGQASVAGRTEGRFPGWFWPTSCAGMTAVAAVLVAMVLLRPEPQVVERLVYAAPSTAARERNARPAVGRGAAVRTGWASRESAAPGMWTAGMAFCPGDDLLALAPAAEFGATAPSTDADATEDQPILSRRSLRALLDRDDSSVSGQRGSYKAQPAGAKL